PIRLDVTCRGSDFDEIRMKLTTELGPGEVKELPIVIERKAANALGRPGQMLLGMAGASAPTFHAQTLKARVFFPAGPTPVLSAQVRYFEPGQSGPTVVAMSDAHGDLHPRGFWRNLNAVPPGTKLGPTAPVLMSILPGQCGATIISLPQDLKESLKLVLPP